MTIARLARALVFHVIAFICLGVSSAPARSQEFRRLFSDDLSTVLNAYQGSVANGNTLTNYLRWQNISNVALVIRGVIDVQSLDPEDLGYPDMTPENSNAARVAMRSLYPDYDFFAATAWVTSNPSRKAWQSEVIFNDPFPIMVNPGDYLEFKRVSRNNTFGPDFGPINAPLPNWQAESIGEVVAAVDFDWQYVPEPASAALLEMAAVTSIALVRRRDRKFAVGGRGRGRNLKNLLQPLPSE
jgi:hypothetical protein